MEFVYLCIGLSVMSIVGILVLYIQERTQKHHRRSRDFVAAGAD